MSNVNTGSPAGGYFGSSGSGGSNTPSVGTGGKGFQPPPSQAGQAPIQYMNPPPSPYQSNPLVNFLLSGLFSRGFGYKDGGTVNDESEENIRKAIMLAKKIMDNE